MKKLFIVPVAALAACAAPEESVELSAEARAELTKALENRVAGDPVACVPLRNLGSNRSIGEDLILFEERVGDTIWLNNPPAGCPTLRFGRALQVDTTISQLCRGDIVTVFDPVSGITYGSCGLGEFVPYRPIG